MPSRSARSGEHPARDHYAEITAKVIAAIEAGTPPWRKPWDEGKAGGPGMPCNAVTGIRYRGINVVTLAMSPLAFTSGDPRWATYKQAAERGWQVRKGARGTTGSFCKRIEVPNVSTDYEETTKRIPLLRCFTLFHASQIEGVPAFVPPTAKEAPWRTPEAVRTIVVNSGAVICIGGDRAFYAPSTDHIQMPPPHAFRSAAALGSVTIHELSHWTGAAGRLNRDLRTSFGSFDYAREELRAELATCMICAELGIVACEFENNAAYLKSWLDRLRADRKEIFRAAADAQRIADYLLAFHPEYAASLDHAQETKGSDGAPVEPAILAEAA